MFFITLFVNHSSSVGVPSFQFGQQPIPNTVAGFRGKALAYYGYQNDGVGSNSNSETGNYLNDEFYLKEDGKRYGVAVDGQHSDEFFQITKGILHDENAKQPMGSHRTGVLVIKPENIPGDQNGYQLGEKRK